MPSFFQGFMMTVLIFVFCAMGAIIIRIALLWKEYTKNAKKEQPVTPKIYYVKETVPQKKKKRKKRKSPNLALKGIVLTPEQIKIIESGSNNDLSGTG